MIETGTMPKNGHLHHPGPGAAPRDPAGSRTPSARATGGSAPSGIAPGIPAEPIESGTSEGVRPAGAKLPVIPLLYVDDDPDQLYLCKRILERSGDFRVDTVDSPKAALAMIRSFRYSVIVSDYQMPEMNGVELSAEVKRSGMALPFVLFTAREWEEIFSPGSNDWKDFYVHKDGNAMVQYAALGRIVRKAAASRPGTPVRSQSP